MYTNDTDKRLYVNADRSKVVEEGDPDAAFLLVGPGGQVSDEDAKKYGLHSKPEAKAQAPVANKAAAKAEDK